MPTNAATVARTIRIFRDQALSPAGLSLKLAAFARRSRDELIRDGEASPSFTTYVDGRRDAAEETVRPDGVILYAFNTLGLAAAFAITFCMARSPVDSGAYRSAWMVVVNGRVWSGDLNDIPANAEVMITNPLPYSRKIDVGHMRMRVPPGIVEAARQQVLRRYPSLSAERALVTIPASLGGGYVLRGRFRRGRRQHARQRLRSDTQKGAEMTYPALIIGVR